MYLEHFGLRQLPFSITPDTSFYLALSTHQDALNTLLISTRTGEGFIKVVGEVGTGKTMLCRKFLGTLDPKTFITAYIPNPYVEPMVLLSAIADELKIDYGESLNQHQLLKLINNFLIDAYASGKRVVLCLDEAQAIPVETLEALRLLSNLETECRKLLQIVLFGQPELDERLQGPSIRQLRQRVSFSCGLKPLSKDEVRDYIAHRIAKAEYHGPRLFTDRAVRKIYRASSGFPRLVNILAHKSLMVAYGEGRREVDKTHVRLAIKDTESLHYPVHGLKGRIKKVLVALTTTVVISVGLYLWGAYV